MILFLTLEGITQSGTPTPVLSYKDSGGNWCPITISGGSVITGPFFGFGTPPCGASTGFSLAAGASLTLPLEVSYSSTNRVGVQGFTAALVTYSPTTGVVPPLTFTSGLAPRKLGSYTVNPVSKYTVTTSAIFPTYAVPQGFLFKPGVTFSALTPLPRPTGTVEFLVTTVVLATYEATANMPNVATFPTSGLSVGNHTFKAEYLGDHVYNPATYTHTFTVGPPPSGTPFTCVYHGAVGTPVTSNAAVTVKGTLPASASSGSTVTVSNLDVTLTYDNVASGIVAPQTSDALGLSPNGAVAAPSATPTVTNDIGTISWTGLSATVSISGAAGSQVGVGVHTIALVWTGIATTRLTYDCTAVSSDAPIGTVAIPSVTPPPPPPPPPPAPPVTTTTTTAPVNSGAGYHLVASNGSVYSYGGAPFYGSMGGQTLNKPIVGTASTPGDGGYWLVASDGGIFSFGNAAFYGSMGGKPLNQPIVGMASTFDGKGYWEVASDGGIFAFGDAPFYGSMGGQPLNKPIVGIAATPDGKGYWEVASDGGIFAFGDAQFYGSTGSLTLNKPIVGVASTANGAGYWLVAADGGVFAFGNAGFHGTVAGTTSAQVVSLVPTADNGGYWETASNGQVFQFGDATSAGTALTQTATIVAMSD